MDHPHKIADGIFSSLFLSVACKTQKSKSVFLCEIRHCENTKTLYEHRMKTVRCYQFKRQKYFCPETSITKCSIFARSKTGKNGQISGVHIEIEHEFEKNQICQTYNTHESILKCEEKKYPSNRRQILYRRFFFHSFLKLFVFVCC